MATRTWPSKQYGNIPALDDHITQHRPANRNRRYSVDSVYFPNLTLAREFVSETKGINPRVNHLSSDVEYQPANGWKWQSRKSSSTKASKPKGYRKSSDAKLAVAAQAAAQEERVVAARKKNGTAKLSKIRKQLTKSGTVRITREVIEGSPDDAVKAARKLGW